jgi:cysteine-rich repeat protein
LIDPLLELRARCARGRRGRQGSRAGGAHEQIRRVIVKRFVVIGRRERTPATRSLGARRRADRETTRILPLLLALLLGSFAAAYAQGAGTCGDGIMDVGEECDDGNAADGDCCSAACTFEGMQLTFPVEEDTYTDGFEGRFANDGTVLEAPRNNQNFGGATQLRADADPERVTYLQFTVSGTSGLTIGRAKVRLEAAGAVDTGADSDDGGTIHLVSDNNWTEHSITHVNRPAIDGPALSSVGAVGETDAVEFDVTVAVGGDGTYSFAITSASENVVKYLSKEAAGTPPQLIVFAGPACDDGDACTRRDGCVDGACTGVDPVVCTPADGCHDAGTCDSGTGLCSNPTKADGSACDDGNGCTQTDTCQAGACIGADPVLCTARDQCHDAGTCDTATGLCSDPAKVNGTPCDDGSACTQTDTCIAGACAGADPIICTALDQCHDAGVCDPASGLCPDPAKPNGSACNDGNACTHSDTCIAGICSGANPVICTASDQCHVAGTCNPTTGRCSNPAKANGSACNDGNACTHSDTCIAGICSGASPVICTASDQCHAAGTCNPATGRCSNPAKANGSACDDGDVCSDADHCIAGTCTGDPMPDSDGDGFCDPTDVCPFISDGAQLDQNGDGIGDMCQCTASAPGRCIAGGGSKKTDCDMEFLSIGPTALNGSGTKLKPEFLCADGDPVCDLDGARDGKCTMGISICFGNSDPRLPGCAAQRVRSVEVLSPKGDPTFEGALAALGLEVRRRNQVISEATATLGNDFCSPLIEMVVPTSGAKRVKKTFSLRATSTAGRADADKFRLVCQ